MNMENCVGRGGSGRRSDSSRQLLAGWEKKSKISKIHLLGTIAGT